MFSVSRNKGLGDSESTGDLQAEKQEELVMSHTKTRDVADSKLVSGVGERITLRAFDNDRHSCVS